MATLKDKWNYPNNSGSGYVTDTDDWSGDASYGIDYRLQEMLDGNYKPWPNLDPVADLSTNVDTFSELVAKYKNYLDSALGSEHFSFYKIFRSPIVVATKKLIDSETITSANVDTTSALITVSGAHEFEDGMLVTISGMNGSWADIDDADYYASDVSNASNGTLKLRVGSASGPYVRFYDLADATITAADVDSTAATITTSAPHLLSNGMVANISGMNGSWADIDDTDYYVSDVTSTTFKLRVGSVSGPYVRFYDLNDQVISSATAVHETTSNLTSLSAHGFSDGDDVILSGFDNSWAGLNGETLYVKSTGSNTLQLATDAGLTNLIEFYNKADGRLTDTAPKKYSSDSLLTFTTNVGDVSTVTDGDEITFSDLNDASGTWYSQLNGQTLYIGNSTGSTFRVYTDAGLTNEVAPYHLASSTGSTATVDGDVEITVPTAPSGYNDDYQNGMPITVSGFDGTFGAEWNNTNLYVQNVSGNTFNVSTDSGGSNLVFYTPNETDVDLDTVELKSDHSISIKIPTRATKIPDGSPMSIEQNSTSSPGIYTDGSTSEISIPLTTDPIQSRWVSSTRLALLYQDELKFYDYTKSTHTLTLDSGATLTITDANHFTHNPSWSTIVCYEISNTSPTIADRMYIITDSGSGYSTDTVDLTTDIATFKGFRDTNTVSISDDGLTLAIGDLQNGESTYGGQSVGKIYIFERASLSDNFDFANPDFTDTGDSTNNKLGTDVILSGDGNVLLAGRQEHVNANLYSDKIYLKSSGTWAEDTTNTIPQYNGYNVWIGLGSYLNSTGTLLVAYSDLTGNRETLVYTRSANNTAWSLSQSFTEKWSPTLDGNYLVAENNATIGTGPMKKLSGSTYSNVITVFNNLNSGTLTHFALPSGGDNRTNILVEESHTGKYYYKGIFALNTTGRLRVVDFTQADTQIHAYLYSANSNAYYLEYTATAGGKDEYTLYLNSGLTLKPNWTAFNGFTAGDYTMDGLYYEMEIAPDYTDSTTGNVQEIDNTPSNFAASNVFTQFTFGSGYNTFTETYTAPSSNVIVLSSLTAATTGTITEVKTADDAGQQVVVTPVAATTGSMLEVKTAEDAGQIVVTTATAATTGSIAPATNEPYKYEIDTVSIKMPGWIAYSYKDVSNVTQYAAQVKTSRYWAVNASSASYYSTTGETAAQFTVGVDASGYLNSISLTEEVDAEGRYADSGDIIIEIESPANLYVAPTPYAEDVWDTDDEWDSDAYSANKLWPTHIAPSGVKITNQQPSSITVSQSGKKYVRSSGILRQQLEVTYPPMTYDDFREFEAVTEAARGQATPFYFRVRNLDTPGRSILLARTDVDADGGLNGPYSVRLREAAAVGDKTLLFEGFPANQSNVFIRGESVIWGFAKYGNGDIVQIMNDNVDSNGYGEAKIRIPYGMRGSAVAGTAQLYKNPSWVIVTLADDNFEYTVGTDGLYRMSVRFDFDQYK